jgi:SOS-response transcriptional repressor LexA
MSTRDKIEAYLRDHPSATVREIQHAVGASSTSVVAHHLKRLDTPRTVKCPTCLGCGRIRSSDDRTVITRVA